MSHSHHKHTPRPPQRPWMSRRQTQEDEERWLITTLGRIELILPGRYTDPDDPFFAPYDDADQRLGGFDNPYQEDHDAEKA